MRGAVCGVLGRGRPWIGGGGVGGVGVMWRWAWGVGREAARPLPSLLFPWHSIMVGTYVAEMLLYHVDALRLRFLTWLSQQIS